MGATITALRNSVRTVASQPHIILVTALAFFAALLAGTTLSFIPIIGQLIGPPISAALMAGIIGMVGYSAFNNRQASIDDYSHSLKSRGTTVFGAVVLEQIAFVMLFLLSAVILFVVGIGGAVLESGASGPDQANAVFGALGTGISLVFLLIFLGVAFLLFVFQFLNAAVVLGNQSIGGAYNTAFGIVKNNPISTLGYTLIRGTLVLSAALFASFILVVTTEFASSGLILVGVIIALGVIASSVTLIYTYHAQYYLQLPNVPIDIPTAATPPSTSPEETAKRDTEHSSTTHSASDTER